MKLLKQNGPFCLVYSAAMILDEDPEVLHNEIGTDGTEVWWGNVEMRGIHIQEIQDRCIARGKCLYVVEKFPYLCPDTEEYTPRLCIPQANIEERFSKLILDRRAILITPTHAIAWDGHSVYDPKGFIQSITEYPTVREAWILGDLISLK